MNRTLKSLIIKDLPSKIVLLTGPRQCGKTTLAKVLYPSFDYFNYDSADDRLALQQKAWDRSKPLVIFDELHKMKEWKRWLKGIFDTEGLPPQLLVTGSAKLDTYRKIGDSLAGRYFQYRLHPLDFKEIKEFMPTAKTELFEQFWYCSGFPEPFLNGTSRFYKRWQSTHLEIMLRQDLLDISAIRDIKGLETLVTLLKTRVGSTVSYANLARYVERDPNTIKRWLQILENLYIIYPVTPYHQNIARALLKEPKYYFYDHAQVADPGARLENIVANALLKELQFIQDTQGADIALHFIRTKEGQELDFLVCIEHKAEYLIEVKSSDDQPAAGFKHFKDYFPKAKLLQLVRNLKREKTFPGGVEVRDLVNWLGNLSF
jgi:uncharacterized protein